MKIKNIFILSFFFFSFNAVFCFGNGLGKADSIIMKTLEFRDLYGKYIQEYDAQIYIKGNTQVLKKNKLFKYAPDFLYWDKKGNNSFVESIVDVHYSAPNHFTQEIKAINGTKLNAEDIQERVMQFLNVNVYNPTIFNDRILFPTVKNPFKYYRFEYVNSIDTLEKTIHEIKIIPKIQSQKLISGSFYIIDGIWTIFQFDIEGKWEFSKFRVQTEFGLPKKNFLLPQKTAITFHLNLLGNETINYYFSQFEYHSVQFYSSEKEQKSANYDLSDYFNIRTDSVPIIKDSLFWEANRPIPLSSYEESLINDSDSIGVKEQQFWNFSRALVLPKKIKYDDTHFGYSGLLNPLKLAYSKMDGILYWQQFKLEKYYKSGKELKFNPNLGILFQKKEVYFSTPVHWLFAPEKMGEVYFSFENKNQSYSSKIINIINEQTPRNIDFDDFDLEYYKHYHTDLNGKYEFLNGLLLQGGVDFDWYIPVKKKNVNPASNEIVDIFQNQYRAFTPIFGFKWTPQQYYRINGKKKEYIGSRFPTFSGEFARGINGVFKSNSYYERIEIDLQQKISVGLMRSFHYYAGAGWFTNTESVYFADFKNFRKRNIPQSWDDPIGGTFHLLRGDWYNASNSYVQAHFMYESPFALLRLFKGISKDILKERIYASQLYIPALPCYTEVGYGIGNFFFNAGAFVSLKQGQYESIGVKFEFELGR